MGMGKLWKQAERKLCAMLGGTRRGQTGHGESDCVHEWLAIEIKCNRRMPGYIKEWVAQANANAEDDQLPIVVWHDVGDEYLDALVIIPNVRTFLEWFGDGEPLPGWPCPECGATTIYRFSECANCGSLRRQQIDRGFL